MGPTTKEQAKATLRKEYEKTMKRPLAKKPGSLTVIVTEDTYDKALTAFNISVAAIEMGMTVSLFFTSRGINIITKSYKPRRARWGEAPIGWKENIIKRRGGSVLAHLMYQAKDMGVHFYACYTSMLSAGIPERKLLDNVKIIRMTEFLGIAADADIHLVIG